MKKKQILVCDDHQSILELMKRGLSKSLNVEVRTVKSGNALISYLKNPPIEPDLLILDLLIPDLEGDDAIPKIRQDERYKNLPIILMSGVIANLDVRAEVVGANDYIKKPFSILTLTEKIKPYLLQTEDQ